MTNDPSRMEFEVRDTRPFIMSAVVAFALVLQVCLPLGFESIDLPLLALVYVASSQRHGIKGLLTGAAVGLVQDSLTQGPIGVFGILKTVIGYGAATAGQYIRMDFMGVRSILMALCFLVHQALYWIMETKLACGEVLIDPLATLILTALHAAAALSFGFLDRFCKMS